MVQRKNTPSSSSFFLNVKTTLLKSWRKLRCIFHETKVIFLASFAKWIDPKLEKYRIPTERKLTPSTNPSFTNHDANNSKNYPNTLKTSDQTQDHTSKTTTPYTPQTIEEFLSVMKRTPRSVLNRRERHVIATIMNFPSVRVSEIMLPPSAITYVNDDEVLGPLTLDRLYKSGYQHFPVIDSQRRIIGLIHTTALNSLEVKKTSHAREILDPKVYYLREDYTLNQALAAFLRTNCYFFIVIDRYERIVGMLTYQMLIDYLLGETPIDKFDRDSDRLAVAKRKT